MQHDTIHWIYQIRWSIIGIYHPTTHNSASWRGTWAKANTPAKRWWFRFKIARRTWKIGVGRCWKTFLVLVMASFQGHCDLLTKNEFHFGLLTFCCSGVAKSRCLVKRRDPCRHRSSLHPTKAMFTKNKGKHTHTHSNYSNYLLLVLRFELGVVFLSALCLYDPLWPDVLFSWLSFVCINNGFNMF